jgi:hypothetical protein
MLTLGQIRDDIQADYFNEFTDIKAVKRAIKRVFNQMNSKLQGIDVLEDGLELIVAPIEEALAFDPANQQITTTTDQSSLAEPGDVIVIYDSDYNNKAFTLSSVVTTTLAPIPSQPIFTENSTCTYCIYRPKRKETISNLVQTSVTYVDGGGAPTVNTIESVGLEIDFIEAGVKAGSLVRITGATGALNNSLYEISSTTAAILSVKTLGKSGLVTADSTDPCVMTIYANPLDEYTYDLLRHQVGVPDSVKLLNGIDNNNDELSPVSYEYLKHSDNDSAKAFTPGGRLKAMLGDTMFVGAGDILRFNVKRDLVVPVSSYPDAVIDIPQKYEMTLFLGVVREIAALPKNYNKEIYDRVYADYAQALAELDYNEPSVNPPIEYKLRFHF